ncbi:MAG TPA: multicopper oxidase domain-containing protein, partial [Gammaproteobacteria bacterium]
MNVSISRRRLLLTGAAMAAAPAMCLPAATKTPAALMDRLVAAPAKATLLGASAPSTDVWAYNGGVPGPELRLRVGQQLRIQLDNRLAHPTTLHWHGMRVPNGMDGVPDLTQPPVPPGGQFEYRFTARDPGTFWYHPHFQSAEQLDRGLHGVVVVEDERPLEVDRDLVWVLDDWRLGKSGQIVDDFGDLHDVSHQGRIGNTATVGGLVPADFVVKKGERIRLRLVNVANAWIFGLDFRGHHPMIIAYDGHAVEPHVPSNDLIVIGPSQRVDVLLDMTGEPGERFEVLDRYYRNQTL